MIADALSRLPGTEHIISNICNNWYTLGMVHVDDLGSDVVCN